MVDKSSSLPTKGAINFAEKGREITFRLHEECRDGCGWVMKKLGGVYSSNRKREGRPRLWASLPFASSLACQINDYFSTTTVPSGSRSSAGTVT